MDMLTTQTRRQWAAAQASSVALDPEGVTEICDCLTTILADMFAMFFKTKNFRWHMTGPHFRDYHLLLDEQSAQIFAETDPIAERVRKLGGATLRSIGHVARLHVSPTTTRMMSARARCWLSCRTTTGSSRQT